MDLERVRDGFRGTLLGAAVGEALGAPFEGMPAALYCFLRNHSSFADTIRYAISLGGDTDTIASMAGALAGAYLGAGSIPLLWREEVEDSARLRSLADSLLALALRASNGSEEVSNGTS